jgi:hypothetical protein
MIFSEPINGSIPNSTIQFKRIMVKTKYPDGTIGDLLIPTERLYSFGVSVNTSQETGKVTGYTMPMCMWTKDGTTTQEKEWTDKLDDIVEKCKEHLVNNRDDIEKWDLEHADLKRLNPLYFKKDKGKIVQGIGPKLYPKLIQSKKAKERNPDQDGIITDFYDTSSVSLNPLELISKGCFVRGLVKIESIFIGSKITLQVKLFECEVELVEKKGIRRLLRSRVAPTETKTLTSTTQNSTSSTEETKETKAKISEITPHQDPYASDESEEEEEPVVEAKPKTVKKRGRKPATK